MSSNINPYNIDGTFPVANQDNSSQGFRDNFTNIKNNFLYAQTEINDLQSKVLVTSALNGQTINNDMAGAQLRRPQLAAWTQTLYDLSVQSGEVVLDFNLANFQKLTTAGSITLDFANWPSSVGQGALGYGLMRVWIDVLDTAHTLTLPTSVTIGTEEIANIIDQTISFDVPGNYIFDFSSIDGGETYLIFDVTRNHSTFRDPGFYYNDTVNSTLMIGFHTALETALTLETGQDAVSVHGSYNAVQADDLSLNSINTVETSLLTPGYSVTAARGNLIAGDLSAINSNDFLGYNQAYAYTGSDISSGGFQQMAAMGYYATGTNISGNGLGGNIGFFTRQDGDAENVVRQALGIEHDQSVKFFNKAIVSEIDASDNVTTVDINGSVDFADFSGEILVNDLVDGFMYKFLVGSGNIWVLGSTNTDWNPALGGPASSTYILADWVQIEFTSGLYRFTNLSSSRDFSFYTVKTRNNA